MGKADIHAHSCHTSWGDGNQTVEELLAYVEEHTDLDIFAVTDHDNTEGARHAWSVHRCGGYRFQFLPGVEVTNLAGHLLCYFPDGNIVDVPSLRPFWWTVDFVHALGGICIPAHPVYPLWLVPAIRRGLQYGRQLDALEAMNGGIGARAQEKLDSIASEFDGSLPLVGGSDAHDQVAVASVYTSFPGSTIDDFLRALREHTTKPVFVRRPELDRSSRLFTTRRSMTRPGWVHNIWRELSSERRSSA